MKTVEIKVDSSTVIGNWRGMGGAITEAVAYNFAKLKPSRQEALIDAYYGENGLDYCWGRVAVGSCDFNLKPHEYDLGLDKKYILPMLKRVLARKQLRVIASPWSPPVRWKTNDDLCHGGRLRRRYFEDYAHYLRAWLDDYSEQGVKIEFLVPQNEPAAAQEWESCKWSLPMQRKFIYRYLLPALSGCDTRVLVWDHNKEHLMRVARMLFGLRTNNDKVAGMAFHWYTGVYAEKMRRVREKYPGKILVSSEMCCGWSEYDENAWQNDASLYTGEIFACMNAGVAAWLDWNILLNNHGGPAQKNNYVKAPIILNKKGDDFILTPIYKRLKEIAQAIPAGSKILRCTCDDKRAKGHRPAGVVAVAVRKRGRVSVMVANVSNEIAEVRVGNKSIVLQVHELQKISL